MYGMHSSAESRQRRGYEDTVRDYVRQRSQKTALMDERSAREFLKYVDSFDKSRKKEKLQLQQIRTIAPRRRHPSVTDDEAVVVDNPSLMPSSPRQEAEVEPDYHCYPLHELPKCPDDLNLTHELLNKIALVKLNGGLGTTMGCRGPKSAIEVRDGQTFLDLTVRQVEFLNTKYGVDVPLILMNSFNTQEETERILSKYSMHNIKFHTFTQHCFPRIDKHTLAPMPTEPFSKETRHLWYPPGHGNVYAALSDSGLLETLLTQGIEYIFISNIDNLGATVDLDVFYEIVCTDREMCMEVTPRERQDKAGGTIFEYKNKPKLMEQRSLRVGEHSEVLESNQMFNTNNIWLNLSALKRQISRGLELQVLVRETEVKGNITLQLETAAGSAIDAFNNCLICVVPRQRFLPVKTTDDLFGIQSNVFTVKHGCLHLREERQHSLAVPTVKLGNRFRSVDEYLKRLPYGVPDILELDHLTVSGDVHFGNNVKLEGTVIIVAEAGSRIDVASGSVLKDNVVTGNLRIMEH